jgi:hypothetical protein
VPYFASKDNPLVYRGALETVTTDNLLAGLRSAGCLETSQTDSSCTYERGCLSENVFSRSNHQKTATDIACSTLFNAAARVIGVNGLSYVLQQLSTSDSALQNIAHKMGEVAYELASEAGELRWGAEALSVIDSMENHPLHAVTWHAISQTGQINKTWELHAATVGWGLPELERHMFIDTCHGVGHGQTFLLTNGYNADYRTDFSLEEAGAVCVNNNIAGGVGGWSIPCAATCVDGIMHESSVANLTIAWVGEDDNYAVCAALGTAHPVQCYERLFEASTDYSVSMCKSLTSGLSIVQLAGCISGLPNDDGSTSTMSTALSALTDLEGDMSNDNRDANGVYATEDLEGLMTTATGDDAHCQSLAESSYSLWLACTLHTARALTYGVNLVAEAGYVPTYRPWMYENGIQPICNYGSSEALASVLCECEILDPFSDAIYLTNQTWLHAMNMPLDDALATPSNATHAHFLQMRKEATTYFANRRDTLVAMRSLQVPASLGGGAFATAWGYPKDDDTASDYWTTAAIMTDSAAKAK